MLNVFPNLLTYSLFAPLLIRIVLGVFVILKSYKVLPAQVDRKSKVVEILFIISGILILIGLYTQVSALFLIVLTIIEFVRKGSRGEMANSTEMWFMIFVLATSLSLMLSGAGIYAIDFPL